MKIKFTTKSGSDVIIGTMITPSMDILKEYVHIYKNLQVVL